MSTVTHLADLEACRLLLRGGSKTFFAASLLLPRPVREPAIALYAFCRLADDAVDLGQGPAIAVARLRERLRLVCAGRPEQNAADRAFAEVVSRFAIPAALPEALLEGLAWDAEGRRYETLSELYGYAARVAGTVGAMMSLLMGAREPDVVARACDLGIAMQLTNIARDVGEDARAGRLYLPAQWLRSAGVDPDAWLAAPVFCDGVAAATQRLLDTAEMFYQRAEGGIGRLPARCRPGIHAARLIYREIGREVERQGFDSVSRRAVVATSRKVALASQSVLAAVLTLPAMPAPLLAETAFLIDAVTTAPRPAVSQSAPPSLPLRERIVWMIDLFERLERRDRLERSRLERVTP